MPARNSSRGPGTTSMSIEKNAKPGGLLRYGIPDFKMEKHVIDRRIVQMQAEGVHFHNGVNVGVDLDAVALLEDYDAIVLAGGAEKPRDLPVPGRDLSGVHFAMEYLPQQNRRIGKEPIHTNEPILASALHVIVIGGGDTGSDCIGTAIRQGALSVTQLEIMPQPPEKENKLLTWPNWPLKMRTSSSQEEGAERDFSVLTKELRGENGAVKKLVCVRLDANLKEIPDSTFELRADLVLLAMGFVSPVHEGLSGQSRCCLRSARQCRGRSGELQNLAATRSLPAATCGAVNRWSSGRSAKAAKRRKPSIPS